MTPQEIKDGMSKGEWKGFKYSPGNIESGSRLVAGCMGYSNSHEDTTDENLANAAAICSAVNNTYGKDLNPEMYSEVVALLIEANERLKQHGHTKLPAKIETVLNAAKL